jgi:hypothetical protein
MWFYNNACLVAHCSKSDQLGKTQQIERVDDHAADDERACCIARAEHLANLRLAHAEILFTRKKPCTSLKG